MPLGRFPKIGGFGLLFYQVVIMNCSYLKPNFKHHPLNYVFVIAFFFVGFFPAQAFAGNTYYSYHTGDGSDRAVGIDQEAACGNWGGSWVDGVQCWANPDKTGGSPVGYWNYCYAPTNHYVSDTAPYCSDTPAPDPVACPSDVLSVVSYEYFGKDHSSSSFPEIMIKDGCAYSMVGASGTDGFDDILTDNPQLDDEGTYTDCVTLVDNSDYKCVVLSVMRSTGDSTEPSTPDVDVQPSVDDVIDKLSEDGFESTTDNRVDESDYNLGDKITEMLNGDSVTTQTSNETVTRGKGFTATKKTDVVNVTRTDGIQKITATTTTTYKKDDGTTKTVVVSNTTYTQKPVDNIIVTKNADGTISITSGTTPGSSTGTTKTTTTNKDADGNTTSESSSSKGECKEGAENCEDGGAGDCDPTKEECAGEKPWEPKEGTGAFDMDGLAAKIADSKVRLQGVITTVRGEASELVEFDGAGSNRLGCLPSITVPHFGTYDMCLSQYSSQLEPISYAFLFIATFIAIMILLRD
jgi:hypothetical protein